MSTSFATSASSPNDQATSASPASPVADSQKSGGGAVVSPVSSSAGSPQVAVKGSNSTNNLAPPKTLGDGSNVMPPPPAHPSSSSSSQQVVFQPMEAITSPHHNDVLCGRGVTTNRHPGNENFRGFVNRNKALYVTSTKRQKMTISRSIVEAVRNLTPPGRFLEKDVNTGLWSDIGDKKAVEKTSQALRDGAASLRKLLSDDLNDPDVIGAVFDDPSKMEAKLAAKRRALKEKAKALDNASSPKMVESGKTLMNNTISPSPAGTMGPNDSRHHHAPVVSPNGSEMSSQQQPTPPHMNPHHHHGMMQQQHGLPPPHHSGPPYGGAEYHDQYYRYDHHQGAPPPPPPHHPEHYRSSYSDAWSSGGSHNNYSYRSNAYYDRKRNASPPPSHRGGTPTYQDMDISPPPSPRIEHGAYSSRRHGGEYWSGMSKDGTSTLFRELKHHATNDMRDKRGYYHQQHMHHRGSSSSYQDGHHRFPSPPHNRSTPTNFVEVTQEGYYQCSSSKGTVTGRFSDKSSSSSFHYYNGRGGRVYTDEKEGLITPSPTRNKISVRGGDYSSTFHDTKKYFEPPPPRHLQHQHRHNHYQRQYDDYHHYSQYNHAPPPHHNSYSQHAQHQYSNQGHPPPPPPPSHQHSSRHPPSDYHFHPNPNVATPSPPNKESSNMYGLSSSNKGIPPPNTEAPPSPPDPNMFEKAESNFFTSAVESSDIFRNRSFDSKNSADAWLRADTDSPLFMMETDNITNKKNLETRSRSDGTAHSSTQSFKSDVTPLPFRTSPTNSFGPFLGFLCCGPNLCEQTTQNNADMQYKDQDLSENKKDKGEDKSAKTNVVAALVSSSNIAAAKQSSQ